MVLSVVAWCEWTKVARDEVKRALQNEVGVQRLLNCDVEYLNYVWCGSMNVRQRSEIPINLVPGGGEYIRRSGMKMMVTQAFMMSVIRSLLGRSQMIKMRILKLISLNTLKHSFGFGQQEA